jgi:hypothetical protein
MLEHAFSLVDSDDILYLTQEVAGIVTWSAPYVKQYITLFERRHEFFSYRTEFVAEV